MNIEPTKEQEVSRLLGLSEDHQKLAKIHRAEAEKFADFAAHLLLRIQQQKLRSRGFPADYKTWPVKK